MFRRVLAAPLVSALLLTGACNASGDDSPAAVAATASPAKPAAGAAEARTAVQQKAKRAHTAPTVAPETVVASTSDATSAEVLSGDWQSRVVAALRKVHPGLVADRTAAIAKVRATCRQMETGLFSTKVLPIIEKRFSSRSVAVTPPMAQDIYAILLQDACYRMNEG